MITRERIAELTADLKAGRINITQFTAALNESQRSKKSEKSESKSKEPKPRTFLPPGTPVLARKHVDCLNREVWPTLRTGRIESFNSDSHFCYSVRFSEHYCIAMAPEEVNTTVCSNIKYWLPSGAILK